MLNLKKVYINNNDLHKIDNGASKSQIYLHHTESGPNAGNVINFFNNNKGVCTPYIIDREGVVYELYDPAKYWSFHLGVKAKSFQDKNIPYIRLDEISIGIELISWGSVKSVGGGKYNKIDNNKILFEGVEDVVELKEPFRGQKYFQKYTDAQISATKDLITYLSQRFMIPSNRLGNIFDINLDAFNARSGIFTHCSVRGDKEDIFPQVEIFKIFE